MARSIRGVLRLQPSDGLVVVGGVMLSYARVARIIGMGVFQKGNIEDMVPLQVNQNVTLVWPLSVHF
jgi:hypothetical protein